LLVLAITLFVLEAKLAAHGVLAVGGAVAMLFGGLLLVEGPPEMRIHFVTAFAVTLPFTVIAMALVYLVVRARLRPAVTGMAGMLAEEGIAYTDLAPEGTVRAHGELWNAISTAPATRGARVRIWAVDGLTLKVEPKPASIGAAGVERKE
jgi:membrane-bound serine protease (ClpP class)